jgi:lipopolysaccharide export LptBFGC system permease protein LptF
MVAPRLIWRYILGDTLLHSALGLAAITLLAVYWMLTSAGHMAAESGRVAPLAGVWLPNLCALALGLYLVRRGMYGDS